MGTRGKTLKIIKLAVGAAALATALAACGTTSATTTSGGKTLDTTTVLLDWFPNPDHVALYLAQKDGDFAASGVNVTFESPSNSTDGLKLVSLGQVPLAISYEPSVITAATQNLNVTAVAALVPTALNSLIISGKSGVSNPGQLAGKTVGTDGDPVSASIFNLILKKHGISLSQTKLVTVNEGLVPAMISGKVAAIISGYRNVEGIQLASEGLNPKVYPVNTEGVPAYDELVIIANKSKLKTDATYRRTVREFLAGLAKGNAAAVASPSAADAALAPVAKGYSSALLQKMVTKTATLLTNPGGFGSMNVSAWQSFADWMKKEGLITAPVNVSSTGLVDTSLLPKG
jgi:putative hydroxymethylpyrimidine transport system substrate-binding protein